MTTKQKILRVLRYVIQYFISLILLMTAIGKLLDVPGFAHVIESFQIFTSWITSPIGLAMSLTELGLAIWLFSGKRLELAALASAALHSTFIAWLLIAMARGLEISNCGCFGVFWARPLGWVTIFEDVFMVAISLTLYFLVRKPNRPTSPHAPNARG